MTSKTPTPTTTTTPTTEQLNEAAARAASGDDVIAYYRCVRDRSARDTDKTFRPPNEDTTELLLHTDRQLRHGRSPDDRYSGSFRAAFAVFSLALYNAWRRHLTETRKASILQNSINNTRGSAAATTVTVKREHLPGPKVMREDMVGETALARCESDVAKAAVINFCLQTTKDNLRRRALLHVLDGGCPSMEDALLLVRSPKNELRQLAHEEPSQAALRQLVRTFVELSDILKDRVQNRFAMFLSETIYIAEIAGRVKRSETFNSTVPYDALISKYLKECIAPKSYADEQEKIMNQFKTDPRGTLLYMLDSLPPYPLSSLKKRSVSSNAFASSSSASASASASASSSASSSSFAAGSGRAASVNGRGGRGNGGSSSSCDGHDSTDYRYDEKRVYQVFDGKHQHGRLSLTNVPHNGKIYHITTYNDCLYDVRGCTREETLDDGRVRRDYELYGHLPWDERLRLLPYRAKIALTSMTGEQLNAYDGHNALTVSWLDDNGFACSRTHVVRPSHRKRSAANGAHRANDKRRRVAIAEAAAAAVVAAAATTDNNDDETATVVV